MPLTEITAEPGPWMSTESVTLSWPVVKVMVPVRPLWKVMTSAPAAALASRIACRRLPAPESLRFVTLNVAASAGAPRPSPASASAAPESRAFSAVPADEPGFFTLP